MDLPLIFLLLTTLVGTIYSHPDGLKSLPNASVFEMKPPKEFLELFKPDDTKNLTNPMKSPLVNKLASLTLADLSKTFPDPSIFEMKPPKEFIDLFHFEVSKSGTVVKNTEKIVNPQHLSDAKVTSEMNVLEQNIVNMKATAESLGRTTGVTENTDSPIEVLTEPVINLSDSKYILDPKVFEMEPPKEFLDLFHLRNKDSLIEGSTIKSIVSTFIPIIPSSTTPSSLSISGDKEILVNHKEYEVKPTQTFTNNENKQKSNQPTNIFNGGIKFPDWFYMPATNPQDITKTEKHSDDIDIHKPHDINWNHQSFESHNYYHQSPTEGFKPFNIFADNDEHPSFQNIFSKKENDNVEQVRNKEHSKIIEDAKTETLNLNNDKTVKLSDNTKIEKVSVLDNSLFVPVQVMTSPQNLGLGNREYMSTLYPSQDLELPMFIPQMPNRAYGFVYTNQPNNLVQLSPHSSEAKPDALGSSTLKNVYDSLQTNVKPDNRIISSIKHSGKENAPDSHVAAMILPSKTVPQTRNITSGNNMVINNGHKLAKVDQNIHSAPNTYNLPGKGESNRKSILADLIPEANHNPNLPSLEQGNKPVNTPSPGQPFSYPAFVSSNNLYSQSQQPAYMNLPHGYNGVPLRPTIGNGALLNGQSINTQNYQINPGQGVMVPNYMFGHNQNNLYALVPITNGYHQATGQVIGLVPAHNNVLLTTKDDNNL